jgi:hypothetical protein
MYTKERSEDDLLRIERAAAIWNEGVDPRGTLAQQYLEEHRKIDFPNELAMTVLRFHPRCPWEQTRVPALIAAFRSIADDAITGIHRIALNADGSKLDRAMLGIAKGAAIKFDPVGAELAIGEGLETCLAGRQIGNFKPAWSLGSAGAIGFFPVIDGVKVLRIFGETGKASADAIRMCGVRWRKAGRRVRKVMPGDGLSDLNDALIMGAK